MNFHQLRLEQRNEVTQSILSTEVGHQQNHLEEEETKPAVLAIYTGMWSSVWEWESYRNIREDANSSSFFFFFSLSWWGSLSMADSASNNENL